ncbi:zinc ribbon domain-containing protein [Microbacterium dauci]|uniref:C4-type zinc ribbon domain-containing protein n=1 Tax=Microbacterium dauci TaxID=3048008 RepID=A0ABT6ZIC0_9MICO|nr:C4-type zinc ribbon domain-containing protein [Microbacterium sp. LX3-4]MDJ1115367.1 C4-type zinc ribbon domain-containing protein [Microbacterium sp. LX3-4]
MNAAPADQKRLLDLASLDEDIRRADAARRNPAQAARVKELLAERATQSTELTRLLGLRDDAKAELARIESDVAIVDARSARDAALLAASTNPKQAQGLEHEIASLAKRKSDLEDAELEVMERLEGAESAVAAQEALIAATNDEGARLSAEGKASVETATAAFDAATRDRAAVAESVPAPLLAVYERLAARGVGAGYLQHRTCGGCRMVLSGTDLNVVRAAAEDAVIHCPECGCILVRDYDSGL